MALTGSVLCDRALLWVSIGLACACACVQLSLCSACLFVPSTLCASPFPPAGLKMILKSSGWNCIAGAGVLALFFTHSRSFCARAQSPLGLGGTFFDLN